MPKTVYATVCLVIALILPANDTATAGASGEKTPPVQVSVHDTDGDGYLSRDEYAVFYREFEQRHRDSGHPAHRMRRILRFEQIDTDADGRISLEEMLSALQQRRQGPGWHWRQTRENR